MRPLLALALGLLAAPLAVAPPAAAQAVAPQPGTVYRVVLVDGREIVGRIAETAEGYVVEDASGVRTTVPRAHVRRLVPATAADGRFTRTDPTASRLFVSPTARTIPLGQRRISTFTVLPAYGVGLTDRVDLSVYSSVPARFDGTFFWAVGANAKAALVQNGPLALAVGTSVGTVVASETDETPIFGTVYAVGTVGSATRSATVGVSGLWGGTLGSEVDVANGLSLTLGGDVQVGNGVKLMTENLVALPFESGATVGTLHLVGVRFFGEQISGDLAAVAASNDGSLQIIPIPYFGFAYNF